MALVALVPVGLSEVAMIIGVSRQRAVQIVRDYPDFPAPLARLASGRVWSRTAVEAWALAHPDRRPGRPRKLGESQEAEGRAEKGTRRRRRSEPPGSS